MANTKWQRVHSENKVLLSETGHSNVSVALASVSLDDTVSFGGLRGLNETEMAVASMDPFAPNKVTVFICKVIDVLYYEKVAPKVVGFAEAFTALHEGYAVTRLTQDATCIVDTYKLLPRGNNWVLHYDDGDGGWNKSDVEANVMVNSKFIIVAEED